MPCGEPWTRGFNFIAAMIACAGAYSESFDWVQRELKFATNNSVTKGRMLRMSSNDKLRAAERLTKLVEAEIASAIKSLSMRGNINAFGIYIEPRKRQDEVHAAAAALNNAARLLETEDWPKDWDYV